MSGRPALPGGPYLVAGLARSGIAAALALRGRGEKVIGVDAGAPEVERLRAAGVEVHLNDSGVQLVSRARTLVKSPGVPQDAAVVRAARAHGIDVVGELELAWRMLDNDFIAVTGTNGKTTTTELIGHIHREAGLPVAVVGNVGTAVASLVGDPALDPAATVVCECSSFQLEDTTAFAPDVAVLLNVAPDHLDRHGTLADYREAKLNIFRWQHHEAIAVLPSGFDVDPDGVARRVTFGTDVVAEMTVRDGTIVWRGEPLLDTAELQLPGPHNVENAMAAAAATLARGVDRDAVRAGLRSFRGVPHRLEAIAERDGIRYVNDSKATNVASAIVALRSYADGVVRLIAGGVTKAQDFAQLAPVVAERCAAVYLIGEGASKIGAALAHTGVPLHDSGDLEHALAAARTAARPGEVVLLSPACASFDQFTGFEARGDCFRRLVLEG